LNLTISLYFASLFHITGRFSVADFAFSAWLCTLMWSFVAGFVGVDRSGVGSAVIDVITLSACGRSMRARLDLPMTSLQFSTARGLRRIDCIVGPIDVTQDRLGGKASVITKTNYICVDITSAVFAVLSTGTANAGRSDALRSGIPRRASRRSVFDSLRAGGIDRLLGGHAKIAVAAKMPSGISIAADFSAEVLSECHYLFLSIERDEHSNYHTNQSPCAMQRRRNCKESTVFDGRKEFRRRQQFAVGRIGVAIYNRVDRFSDD
jgi:hypothetical protein